MRARLLDCWSREHFEEIGDIEDIACIIFVEVSGDQTLEVYYKDGDSDHFDSSSDRFRSLDVELDVVYLPAAGIDKRAGGMRRHLGLCRIYGRNRVYRTAER